MYSEEFVKHFWERVDKIPGRCWLWTGSSLNGYGKVSTRINGVVVTERAHRVSLKLHLGRDIAEGMVVAHTPVVCHNRLCVNPYHLKEKTHSENALDKHFDGTMVNNVRRKLTEQQVIAIRNDTRKQTDIAVDYGITSENVHSIKLRKSWKHII
jgi:hypothetical protein